MTRPKTVSFGRLGKVSPYKATQMLKQKLREAEYVGKGKVKIDTDRVITYFDGEGNIIGQNFKDSDGRTWKLPSVGPVRQRKKIYTYKSFKHPARMSPIWCQRMIQEYSKPSDLILDPMAGIGTTSQEASRLGRNAVIIELEPKWIKEAKRNYDLLKKDGQAIGTIYFIEGDARKINLSRKADVIIFSPPYENMAQKGRGLRIIGPNEKGYDAYSSSDLNIGMQRGREHRGNMALIYSKCYENLKPQGILVVNTKDRIENNKLVSVRQATRKVVTKQGFKFIIHRKIPAKPSKLRLINEEHNPQAPHIRFEDVQVFRKK